MRRFGDIADGPWMKVRGAAAWLRWALYKPNSLACGSDLTPALGVHVIDSDLGHLFYNAAEELVASQAGADWWSSILERERYVWSLTDPERREAVGIKLRVVALGEIQEFERDLDRREGAGGHPEGAPGELVIGGKRA